MDKQDPCLKVWFNDLLLGKTKRQQDAGVQASFDECFKNRIPQALYKPSSVIRVEAFNESRSGSLTSLGVGSITITEAIAESKIGSPTSVSIPLSFSKGKDSQGQVILRACMKAMQKKPVVVEQITANTQSAIPQSNPLEVHINEKTGPSKAKTYKAQFEQGRLCVMKIQLAELSQKGREASVVLELDHSASSCETTPQTKAVGGICNFQLMDMHMDVERYHIHGGKCTVHLFEHNRWNPLVPSRVHIGAADVELGALLLNIGQEVSISATFLDETKAKVGKVTLTLKLEQWNDSNEKTALEIGLGNGGLLEILSIRMTDMKNFESALSSAVKRPYAKFKYGSSDFYTTDKEVAAKEGCVQWDHLNWESVDLTDQRLHENSLHVELYDRGVLSDTLLGSCDVSLKEARLNEETLVKADIMKRGNIAASLRALIKVSDQLSNAQHKELNIKKLQPSQTEELIKAKQIQEQARIKAVTDFIGGCFQIKSITCKDMTNVEVGSFLGDQNDPYAVLKYGNWSQITSVQDHGGSDVCWDDLYFTVDVSKESLPKTAFEMELWDKNTVTADAQIGTASFLLSDYALDFDYDGDVNTVDTNNGFKIKATLKDKKQRAAGCVVLECMMKPSRETTQDLQTRVEIPSGFEKGVLFVSKIKASNLRRNDSNDKQSYLRSPYVAIDYCQNTGLNSAISDNTNQMSILPMLMSTVGNGPNATWDAFQYQQRVSRQQLQQESMHIYVKDNEDTDVHNRNLDDKVVCEGVLKNLAFVSSQKGREIEITVDLYAPGTDFNNLTPAKRRGELLLFCRLQDTTGQEDTIKASPRIDEIDLNKTSESVFTKGYLAINYIQAKGLSIDGKVAVNFQIEGDPASKEVLPVLASSAKGDLHWEYKSRIPVTLEMLKTKAISLFVEEQQTVRGNSPVGTGTVKLDFFVLKSRLNIPVELSIPLLNGKGQSQGRAIIGCELQPAVSDSKKAVLPDNFKGAVLHIFKIQTHNLKNTEMVGLADPYIVLKDHHGHEIGRTFTAQDKGGSVLFDILDIRTSQQTLYTAADIMNNFITVEAFDENVTRDTFIGTGTVKLAELLGPFNIDVELPAVHLADAKGNLTGRVHIFAKLEEPLPPKDIALTFPKNFETGTAYIKRIVGFNIENKNFLGAINKADPYLEVSVLADSSAPGAVPIWTEKTAPVMDIKGSHASWDYLDFEFPVSRQLLEKGSIWITAKDKNFIKNDAVIGSGTCSLRRSVQSIKSDEKGDLLTEGDMVELSVDLNFDAPGKPSKQGTTHGRLVVQIQIGKTQPKDSELRRKSDFEYGVMHISKIRTFDLANREVMAKLLQSRQDPYIKLKFGDWQEKTHAQENGGGDILWDFLAMECPVYSEDCTVNKLQLQVYDENNLRADALIGSGEVSVVKSITAENIGQEVKLTTKIVDAEGKPSGKVEVYVTTIEPVIGGEIPASFDLGVLTVKKAKILGLNPKLSLPFLKFQLNEQIETTESYSESSSDPSFDLNWRATCNKVDVGGKSDLLIQVLSKSSITGSTNIIGTTKIQLKPAGINLNKDVELSGVVLNEKGIRIGRVVLLARLVPDVVKSIPVTETLPSTFVSGILTLSKLQVTSTSFIDKKIYARIEYGAWNECTNSQTAGKSSAYALNMPVGINKTILQNDCLKVVILEEGSFMHGVREIAYGAANAKTTRKICSNFKRKIDVDLELLPITSQGNNGEIIGRAQLEVCLDDAQLSVDNDDSLPDNVITFKTGTLQIHKVAAYDLTGGDLIGKQDPYIAFSIENIDGTGNNWHAQTLPQKNAGRSVIWDHVTDIATDVSADTLKYKRLVIVAMDKNNYTGDALMGQGDVGLKGPGSVPNERRQLKIKLKDKKGRAAGYVEVLVSIFPRVDMSSGIDVDQDGADDGLEATKMNGTLQFNAVSITRSNGNKSDKLYVQFSLSGWRAETTIETDRFGEQTWRWEQADIQSKKLNTAQILQEGLVVKIYKMKGKTPSPTADELVAEVPKLNCSALLSQLATFLNIKADASLNGSFVGKFIVGAKFSPEKMEAATKQRETAGKQGIVLPLGADQALPTPLAATSQSTQPAQLAQATQSAPSAQIAPPIKIEDNAQFRKLKEANDQMAQQMKGMEAHIKAQMEQLLKSQTSELRKSLEDLEKMQRKAMHVSLAPAPAPAPAKKEKWDIFNVTNVELPANVDDWRVAHVQAWLAFQVELPAYMESFQKASIDGRMLLAHVDETTLTSMLSVSNALHKVKLMAAIETLKERQEVINKKNEALRKAHLRKAQAEHEAELERVKQEEEEEIRRLEKENAKKTRAKEHASEKKKAPKSSKASKVSQVKADVQADLFVNAGGGHKNLQSEQAQIDRVRMERAAKQALAKKKAHAAKMNAASRTWRFEYTGAPKPKPKDIWADESGDHPALGTTDYQNAMETLDILDDGIQQGAYKKMHTNYRVRPIRALPKQSSVDEVIAAVKGAMYELSTRLLQIQEFAAKKDEHVDDDLISCDYSIHEVEADAQPSTELATKSELSLGQVPTYEDVVSKDEDWITAPPPEEDPIDGENSFPDYQAPELVPKSPMRKVKTITLVKKVKERREPAFDPEHHKDRMGLVYEALIMQSNNDASFIGSNDKLTRLKLYGGCESLLRLRLTWSQFDSMWTRLDMVRTGDLNKEEFKAFFGDLSEFESKDGVQTLGTTGSNVHNDMKNLTRILYELCDVMRHAGFTVNEMFSSFDRDGSGNISINEFCSMLRLILGPTFDRKQVYQSLLCLDTDRSKSISKEEFFMFIYKTWKLQMDEIDYKKSCLDESKPSDADKMQILQNERDLIKVAVKKNFPRTLRDVLDASDTALAGPFATLFKDDLNSASPSAKVGEAGASSPQRDVSRSLPVSPISNKRRGRSSSPNRPHSSHRIDNTGQIMRFRIHPPGAASPTRKGERLAIPTVTNLNKNFEGIASAEAVQSILNKTAPIL